METKPTKLSEEGLNPLVQEFRDWLELQKTGGIHHLTVIFKKHKAYCYDQAMSYLKQHEDRKADCWRARGEDMDKLLSLIQKRVEKLNKEVMRNDNEK